MCSRVFWFEGDCRNAVFQCKKIIINFSRSFFGSKTPLFAVVAILPNCRRAVTSKTEIKTKRLATRGAGTLLVALSLAAMNPQALAFEPLLPDRKLTPGKIAKHASDTCGVTESMQDEVFARYRISPGRRRYYVIDHLIPKELGGSDDVRNLWPQKVSARPYGARRKKILTQHFLEMIAAKQITLAEAQREMSEDWISAFVTHIGMVYLSPNAEPVPVD